MKQIIDKDGNIVDGIYRSPLGHLVVIDHINHKKYIKSKQTLEEVDDLKLRLEELTKRVSVMMNRLETHGIK